MSPSQTSKQLWEDSFKEQIAQEAYNTAPVEAVVRTVSYYFRDRYSPAELGKLHFLEIGCGAGPNLIWLARKGVKVSGIDISPIALQLTKRNLEKTGCADRIERLVESPADQVPFPDGSFDGVVEACVFQHLAKKEREGAFREVARLLKPSGLFVGYLLDAGHSVFRKRGSEELKEDPGTLLLNDGSSKLHLTNLGLCHFYRREEIRDYLRGFSLVDPCLTSYYLPRSEAKKRGYDEYLQSMWTVYAIK